MLPKPVADDLRQGRTAEAQSFSNTTVYFRFVFFICTACIVTDIHSGVESNRDTSTLNFAFPLSHAILTAVCFFKMNWLYRNWRLLIPYYSSVTVISLALLCCLAPALPTRWSTSSTSSTPHLMTSLTTMMSTKWRQSAMHVRIRSIPMIK